MRPGQLPLAGACRCGAVRVEVSAAPLLTAACHCTGCRRMSGSAFSLTAMIPAAGFRVTQGHTVVGGLRGPQLQHHFCPACMTWIVTRVAGVDRFVNLRPGVLEDQAWFSPFIETMTREKLPWATTPARHRYAGFPSMEELDALMDAYARAG